MRLSLSASHSISVSLSPLFSLTLPLSLFLVRDTPSLSDVRSFDHPVLRPPFALSRDAWKNHEGREHGRKGIPNNNNSDGFGSSVSRIGARTFRHSDHNFFRHRILSSRSRTFRSVKIYV